MMQGDPRVDDLMRPVHAAIKRHVKDSDAVTDIYNRAYEAIMNSMDVKSGKTYCAYCGAEYPLDDNAANQVSEHIKMCEKHPMRAVEARAEAAEARAERLQAELDKTNYVLRETGFRIANDTRPGFGYVLIGHGIEYVPVYALKGGEE